MAESNHSQLRFDILEKVRLHPQQPGIRSLLDLDLYPDVEIEDQDTHLKIHGYLRLNGEYLGEDPEPGKTGGTEEFEQRPQAGASSGNQEIAYVIPVEITLPADRVDLDRISSEIQSFDYKVLSPFELQIEAVLTIDGLREEEKKEEETPIEVVDKLATFSVPESGHMAEGDDEPEPEESGGNEPLRTAEDLEPRQDEYQFVHVARSDSDGEVNAQDLPEEESRQDEGSSVREEEEASAEPVKEESVAAKPVEEKEEKEEKEKAAQKPVKEKEEKVQAPEEEQTAIRLPEAENPGGKEEQPREEEENLQENEEDEEKNVVFHSRRPVEDREEMNLSDRLLRQPHDGEFDFQNLNDEGNLSPHPEGEEESTPGEEENAEDASEKSEEPTSGSGLEWTKWLIRDEKEEEFVKLRMVIVHQEDTIESLAERYEVPPNKIQSMNRMESNILEEGQIVYIPTQK